MLTIGKGCLTDCGNVCLHTSVPFQILGFDFLLGKVPRGKEAHLCTLARIIERTEFEACKID